MGDESVSADIPFDYRDGLIWVQITVPQSPRPLNFLLDSGAAVSVVNLGTAQRLGLKPGRPVSVGGVGGALGGFWPQRLTAKLGDLALPSEYLAVDLTELSNACACGVDGLLGADFFKRRMVEIDFRARRIRLLSSRPSTNDAAVVDLKFRRQAFLAPVRVNGGKPQWVRVDTGCTAALHWVTRSARKATPSDRVSVGLAKLNIPETTAFVKLGHIEFSSLPTSLHERPIFPGEAGLLGNGVLSRFERVIIDAQAGVMFLHKLRVNQ